MMFRVYTSTFVLICVVTQVLTDIPEGICQRQRRFYQQVSKQTHGLCTRTRSHCYRTFFGQLCYYHAEYYECMYVQYKQTSRIKLMHTCCDGYSLRNGKCEKDQSANANDCALMNMKHFLVKKVKTINRNYKCTYLQHLQVAKVKLTYTCCNGYYSRNGRCEKEAVNATPGTTCTTYLSNDTCTNDTTGVTDKLPVPTDANKDQDTNWNTSAYNEASEKKTTTSIGISSTHKDGNQTEGVSRDISMIVAVLLTVVALTNVAVIICLKVRHHRKPKTQSLEEIELQPPQNIPWDQNAAHETEDIELRDESGIYFSLEPRDDQTAYENIDDEFFHDADGTRNPYDTVDRRNRYSIEADPREDVNGQGVPDSKDEIDIYHHLNRNRKETYNTDVYGILSGVELSQIQL